MKKIIKNNFNNIKKMENPLEGYRDYIDYIDSEIILLLSQRFFLSKEI
jgi:chorismate mutase